MPAVTAMPRYLNNADVTAWFQLNQTIVSSVIHSDRGARWWSTHAAV